MCKSLEFWVRNMVYRIKYYNIFILTAASAFIRIFIALFLRHILTDPNYQAYEKYITKVWHNTSMSPQFERAVFISVHGIVVTFLPHNGPADHSNRNRGGP